MAGLANFMTILGVVLLLQVTLQSASALDRDDLAPALAPFLDELCKEVVCGKGTCKSSLDYKFNYECECEDGWKRSRADNEEDLKFLPCVIPNCTLDYSCTASPPPVAPINEAPRNESVLDPCYYAYCGEGTCVKSMKYGHRCECNPGFNNLLNITAFPCYNECVIGNDCASLGITSSKDTSSSTGSKSGDNSNDASSSLSGSLIWLTALIMSVAMIPRA
ncbi:hypothetical protein MKW98_001863 [Papaver atlanticum]|uniref:Uncharacterized protein n=1 Tax=Papaver atlanticum TaxID=357466 RepID=A0AAD4T4A3_9MAGN|nr:hypothetical protein MKW98_001863 [Papaver atlanticum]